MQPVNALAFVSMKVSSIMMHTAAMTAAMNADDMSLETRKFSDVQNAYCNHAKIQSNWSFHREICLKNADGMANTV